MSGLQPVLFGGGGRTGEQASLHVPSQPPKRSKSPAVRILSLETQYTLLGPSGADPVLVLADGRRVTLTGPEWDRLLHAFGAPSMGETRAWNGRRVRIVAGSLWPATDSAAAGCTGPAPALF